MWFLMAPYITLNWFHFFILDALPYIYCLFPYFTKEFLGHLEIFLCLKNVFHFSYLRIHRTFIWIFNTRFSFIIRSYQMMLFHFFSFNTFCFPRFHFVTLTHFIEHEYFCSVFLYLFYISKFNSSCPKLFCWWIMVIEIITLEVAYIISFKRLIFGWKSFSRSSRVYYANFICIINICSLRDFQISFSWWSFTEV